ncbi:MAG: hypothetical protein C5B51_27625 [Terriglobia bacterium]|nr:MAG: hypothetical protein C5B51_27625 [Terriglobia bacterium]
MADFLTGAFQLPRTAPFVQPALMQWKYDDPRPDWNGSRSYAWMEGGRIAAHACLCPVTYRAENREITGSYLIDWAALRLSPGAGVFLLRKLSSLFQVLWAIGGSQDTQTILPKLGYQAAGELSLFARVMRPWRQSRNDPARRGWKAPLRLARNTLLSRLPAASIPAHWTCTPLPAFDSGHIPLLQAVTPHPTTQRTPELMNYFLRCPGAKMSAYVIREKGVPRGWFVISRVAGVSRIADFRLHSAAPDAWQAGYGLALKMALGDREGCELIAAATTPLAAQAIRRNGFRLRSTQPVFLLDPGKLLLPHLPLEVNLIESDAAYLYDPQYPYLT